MTNPLLDIAADRLPPFADIRPEHVEPAVQETLTRNREALQQLLAGLGSNSPSFEHAVLPLEPTDQVLLLALT